MEKLLETLNQYLQSAQAEVVKHGPQVWDSTLQLVRMQSIFNLITLALCTAGCCVIAFLWHRFLQKKIAAQKAYEDWQFGYVAMAAPGLGLAICIIGWCSSFNDWLGAFAPQLAILYRVAVKAGVL